MANDARDIARSLVLAGGLALLPACSSGWEASEPVSELSLPVTATLQDASIDPPDARLPDAHGPDVIHPPDAGLPAPYVCLCTGGVDPTTHQQLLDCGKTAEHAAVPWEKDRTTPDLIPDHFELGGGVTPLPGKGLWGLCENPADPKDPSEAHPEFWSQIDPDHYFKVMKCDGWTKLEQYVTTYKDPTDTQGELKLHVLPSDPSRSPLCPKDDLYIVYDPTGGCGGGGCYKL